MSNPTTISLDIPNIDLEVGLRFLEALSNGNPLSSCCLAAVDQSYPEDPLCTVCGSHQCELAAPVELPSH